VKEVREGSQSSAAILVAGRPAAHPVLLYLQVASLRKYIYAFDLDVAPNSSKEAMTAAVQRHWQSQVGRSLALPLTYFNRDRQPLRTALNTEAIRPTTDFKALSAYRRSLVCSLIS
jgi:hypothetical protein